MLVILSQRYYHFLLRNTVGLFTFCSNNSGASISLLDRTRLGAKSGRPLMLPDDCRKKVLWICDFKGMC